ncbi:MAG: polyphenol oxidase family protein [Pseudomonadota bacterium]
MIPERSGSVTVFRFALLSGYPELVHGVFAREGGTSPAPFHSLNVAFGGDEDACVAANRRIIESWTGGMRLAPLRQVHGTRVHVFNGAGADPVSDHRPPPEADAAVTAAVDTALLIQVADCQPVMLFDPQRRVVANVHSGWRGSIDNVIGRTVAVMETDFGCRPRDLVAGIGPSLGPCCAEFINYASEIPKVFWGYRRGAHHFDFWAISREQLSAAGVPDENIETGGICTRCHPNLFYSYRHERLTGRSGAVIALRPPLDPEAR